MSRLSLLAPACMPGPPDWQEQHGALVPQWRDCWKCRRRWCCMVCSLRLRVVPAQKHFLQG